LWQGPGTYTKSPSPQARAGRGLSGGIRRRSRTRTHPPAWARPGVVGLRLQPEIQRALPVTPTARSSCDAVRAADHAAYGISDAVRAARREPSGEPLAVRPEDRASLRRPGAVHAEDKKPNR